MALPKASELVAGKVAKASSVLENDQYLEDLINSAITEARVMGCYVSKLIGDTTIPPSLLPRFGTADGIPLHHPIHSQAQMVQALDLQFRGRHAQSVMSATDPGAPSPAYGGFVVCDANDDTVSHYVQTAIDGNWSKTTYSMDSGDEPRHAVALRNGKMYVACEGSYKVRVINTRKGTVADFVDLTGYSADFNDANTELGQIITNRQGTALYMQARIGGGATATSNRSVVMRIAVPSGTMTKMSLADDYDIAGLAFTYPGQTDFSNGTLVVARTTNAANTGAMLRVAESDWSDGGTISTVYINTLAGNMVDGICEFGSAIAMLMHTGTGANPTDLRYSILDYHDGYVGNAIQLVAQVTDTVTALYYPVVNSLGTDGYAIYWQSSGNVPSCEMWAPGLDSRQSLFPTANATEDWNYPGGIIFTGDTMVSVANHLSGTRGDFGTFSPFGG